MPTLHRSQGLTSAKSTGSEELPSAVPAVKLSHPSSAQAEQPSSTMFGRNLFIGRGSSNLLFRSSRDACSQDRHLRISKRLRSN